MSPRLRILTFAGMALAGCAGEEPGSRPAAEESAASRAVASADYIGGESCRECHQKEWDRWVGSDHDLAMQPADSSTLRVTVTVPE